MRTALATLLVASLVGSPLAGCSFIVANKPSPPPGDPACVRSAAPVVIDGIAATVAFFGTGIISIGKDNDEAVIGGSLLTLGLIGSMVYGIVRTSRCRGAYEDRGLTPPG